MKIKSQKDFFAGLMFMGVGVAFAWGASTYNIGTGARMGPGYFPLLLGILLAFIGGLITFKATTVETQDGDKIGKWAWKPLFFVLAANFVFGILLAGLPSFGVPAMGLIVAIYALTFISSLAGARGQAPHPLPLRGLRFRGPPAFLAMPRLPDLGQLPGAPRGRALST